MHTSKFGVHQLLSIPLSVKLLLHVCTLNSSRFRNLPHSQQTIVHTGSWRHTWEGCWRLSVECAPPSLVTVISHCVCETLFHVCASIHSRFRNLQHNQQAEAYLEGFLPAVSRMHTSKFGVCRLLSYYLCQINFLPCVSIDPFKDLEIYRIIRRLESK